MDVVDNRDPTVRKVLVNEPQLKYMLAPIIDPPNIIQPAYCKYPEFFYIFATCKYEKDDIAILIKHLRKLYRKMCKAESLKKEGE